MRPVHVLNVFTDAEGGAGNPLGVVGDMTGLREEQMQPIATELGYSETVFIDWRGGGIPSIRIFTPANELPFAGHPLVGAAWYLNSMGPGVDGINAPSGYVAFSQDDGLTWITAPESLATVEIADDGGDVCRETGWPSPLAAHNVLMPRRYLMLNMGDVDIGSLAADPDAMPMGPMEGMVYPYRRDGGTVRSRAFVHAMGIPEDPATGSAAAAYATLRLGEGEDNGELLIRQGPDESISEISLAWDGSRIRLGGRVVKVTPLEID